MRPPRLLISLVSTVVGWAVGQASAESQRVHGAPACPCARQEKRPDHLRSYLHGYASRKTPIPCCRRPTLGRSEICDLCLVINHHLIKKHSHGRIVVYEDYFLSGAKVFRKAIASLRCTRLWLEDEPRDNVITFLSLDASSTHSMPDLSSSPTPSFARTLELSFRFDRDGITATTTPATPAHEPTTVQAKVASTMSA